MLAIRTRADVYDRIQQLCVLMLMLLAATMACSVLAYWFADLAAALNLVEKITAWLILGCAPIMLYLFYRKRQLPDSAGCSDSFIVAMAYKATRASWMAGFFALLFAHEVFNGSVANLPVPIYADLCVAVMLTVFAVSFYMNSRGQDDIDDE